MKGYFNCVEIIRDSKSIGVSIGERTFDCRILIQKYLNTNGNPILSEQHFDNCGYYYDKRITVL